MDGSINKSFFLPLLKVVEMAKLTIIDAVFWQMQPFWSQQHAAKKHLQTKGVASKTNLSTRLESPVPQESFVNGPAKSANALAWWFGTRDSFGFLTNPPWFWECYGQGLPPGYPKPPKGPRKHQQPKPLVEPSNRHLKKKEKRYRYPPWN